MSFAAALLLASPVATLPPAAERSSPASRAPFVAIASTRASARILAPVIVDFDQPMERSVKSRHARAQISRDRAGTVWAEFQ